MRERIFGHVHSTRTLARPVAPDACPELCRRDAHDFALLDFEGDVFQCPDGFRRRGGAIGGLTDLEGGVGMAAQVRPPAGHVVAQGVAADAPG